MDIFRKDPILLKKCIIIYMYTVYVKYLYNFEIGLGKIKIQVMQ